MSRIEKDVGKFHDYNPYNTLDRAELDDVIGNFIALVWLIKDKKMTKTTFFMEIIDNDVIREIFKTICGCSDVELYRELLIRYPSVNDSKYIRNRLKVKHDKSGKKDL